MSDIMKIDIYELLNISISSDEKEIKSAYRKKALTCHPDKNPDPKAAELFQQLSKALEILTDDKARAAYDQVLKARKAAVVRNRELDSKRKKLKDDLEAREKAALDQKLTQADAAKNLEKEIERLRKEGSRHLEEEKEFLRQQIFQFFHQKEEPLASNIETHSTLPRLKIKWNKNGEDYTESELRKFLAKHGELTCLVISSKKKGTAIAEFSSILSAESVINHETGKTVNPLKISWISGQFSKPNINSENKQVPKVIPDSDSNVLTSRDYESLVLMKMRQAEERKRLIQQIQDEEG